MYKLLSQWRLKTARIEDIMMEGRRCMEGLDDTRENLTVMWIKIWFDFSNCFSHIRAWVKWECGRLFRVKYEYSIASLWFAGKKMKFSTIRVVVVGCHGCYRVLLVRRSEDFAWKGHKSRDLWAIVPWTVFNIYFTVRSSKHVLTWFHFSIGRYYC